MSARLRLDEKRITLRIEESLWATLQAAAWRDRLSLNEYIVRVLHAEISRPAGKIIEHGN